MADAMQTRPLGGVLDVSTVGLGCNNFGRKGSATEEYAGTHRVLAACLDHGITFLDTADIYGHEVGLSEELLGKALKDLGRDNFVIATKWGHQEYQVSDTESWGPKGGRTYIRQSVVGSLRRLNTDVIDLYQHHSPDPVTPIEETVAALAELQQEGKIKHYGHSNYSAQQMRAAHAATKAGHVDPFISEQGWYSLLHRAAEDEVLPTAAELGLGFLPFFPLASGLLTGKYYQGQLAPQGSRLAINTARFAAVTDREWQQLDTYRNWCAKHTVAMLDATFGWMLAQPEVTSMIAGATTPEQVAMNARAGHIQLDAELAAEISEIFANAHAQI